MHERVHGEGTGNPINDLKSSRDALNSYGKCVYTVFNSAFMHIHARPHLSTLIPHSPSHDECVEWIELDVNHGKPVCVCSTDKRI